MIADENCLSKAKDIESLHYQRGLVAGMTRVLFLVANAPKE